MSLSQDVAILPTTRWERPNGLTNRTTFMATFQLILRHRQQACALAYRIASPIGGVALSKSRGHRTG